MDDGFVPIDELARYLNVSVSTVRTWLRNEIIPKSSYLRIGTTYRFSIEEVVDALRNNSDSHIFDEPEPCDKYESLAREKQREIELLLIRHKMLYMRFEDAVTCASSIIDFLSDSFIELLDNTWDFDFDSHRITAHRR